MSVVSEIERIKTNIANAYTELENKGATLPEVRNSENLSSVIIEVPTGGDLSEYFKTEGFTNPSSNITLLEQMIMKIPKPNTSNLTSFANAFEHFRGTELPVIDTSNGTNFSYAYYDCENLIKAPLINTSKGTNFNYMYAACDDLEEAPLIDTSNGTTFNNMYRSCLSMEVAPQIDTSKGTTLSSMYYDCRAMKEAPQIDTSSATIVNDFLYNCTSLEKVPLLDFGKVSSLNTSMLLGGAKITSIGGFKDLGKSYTRKTTNYSSYSLSVSMCSNLTHDSLMNIINNVYDLNITYDVANGGTLYSQKLILGSTNVAKLTAEEIAIATSKGWTVS